MRLQRRFKASVLLAGSLLLITSVAFAGVTDTTVNGGDLTVSGSGLAMSAITLDVTATQTSSGTETITVTDNRGSGAGWNIKVSSTDFTATVDDPTLEAAETLSIVINPSDVLTVAANATTNLVAGTGDTTDGITETTSATAVTTLGVKMLSADSGYGMGQFTNELSYVLTLPRTLTVNIDGSAQVTPSDTVTSGIRTKTASGILAASYAATITYTASTGP